MSQFEDKWKHEKIEPVGSKDTVEKARFADDNLQRVHEQLLREKEEPTEGFAPMPIFMIFLLGFLFFWGGVYIAKYSGGFDPLVYDETLDTRAPAGPPVEVPLPVIGQRVYAQCAACHQQNGQGVPGSFPPLAGSEWVSGNEKALAAIVLHGVMGPIEVKGNTYNGNMPGLPQLSDRQIAGVLTYIRGNQEWGNTAGEVSPELVAQVRAEHERGTQWKADELKSTFGGEE